MKKTALLLSVVGMILLPCFGFDMDVYRHGAIANVRYRVVDDEDNPVSNALAHIWFRTDYPKLVVSDWTAVTDTNGEFVAEFRTNERVSIGVDKEGYYYTFDRLTFRSEHGRYKVVDDKWQPYGEIRTIVLKRIKKPIRLRDPDARYRYKYPESGKWTGFDLACGDWMPPLGKGKSADMMVRYVREPRPDGYFKSLDISFTNNPYAGVYLMDKDSYSEMDSVYEANTNGEYVGNLRYEFERTAKGNHMISELGSGQYLVFRIRTKVDDDGNLISAHYGRIMGALQYLEKGGMVLGPVFFNPTPNDTNLEDAETARLARLRYDRDRERERQETAEPPSVTFPFVASLLSVGAVQK